MSDNDHKRPMPAATSDVVWPGVDDVPELRRGDSVHLVGIGGAGMSGLANVLLDRGLLVSGTDLVDSPVLAALSWAGATVHVGHDAAHVPGRAKLVVRSPAVPDSNPEIAAALAAAVPVAKRAPMLGALLDERIGVAVAGTHGKTTTSGMMAVVLDQAGLDPTFFIGGMLPDLGTSAVAGTGQHVLIEADEYDRSFLHGHPTVAVVTNVEHDHPDIYPDLDAVIEAFRQFVARVRPHGTVILSASPGAMRLAGASRAPVETYAVDGESGCVGDADWIATNVTRADAAQRFDVLRSGKPVGTFTIRQPGVYNVANALAVVAASHALDVDIGAVRDALVRFSGAERRFQRVGSVAGIDVVDDYAHHPTEIRSAVAAAREMYAGSVCAVVQPHTYTRVAALADDFADAVSSADRVVITPVYAAREAPIPEGDPANIVANVPDGVLADDLADAADKAASGAAPGDCLLFMGAGDIVDSSRMCWHGLVRQALGQVEARAHDAGLGGETEHNATLAPYTSLRVGGLTPLMVRVREVADLVGWWLLAAKRDVPILVLGRGSNLLLGDGGFMGLALANRCERWALEPAPDDSRALVVAESGVTLAALGNQLGRMGWAGIEAGIGIPGSLGAAVVNNAGAHGWCMADSLVWAERVSRDGSKQQVAPESLSFGYRDSALRGDRGQLVTRVALEVHREAPAEIAERMDAYAAHRRSTQPTTPSAGSIFKNPPGDYAGRLIEAVGLKGRTHGGASISDVHANFIVNDGAASAEDVQALAELARRAVRRAYGVRLELEIESIGEQRVA